MKYKVNIHMKDMSEYLDNKYLNYLFDADTSLNLIEIFEFGNDNPVNVLFFDTSDKDIGLAYKTDNQDMLGIEKDAKSFLAEFVKVSGKNG